MHSLSPGDFRSHLFQMQDSQAAAAALLILPKSQLKSVHGRVDIVLAPLCQ